MGMPVTVEIAGGPSVPEGAIEDVFAYLAAVEHRFSPFRQDSETTALNQGWLAWNNASPDMREVLAIAEDMKLRTSGYFEIHCPGGRIDPTGVVKGWAIHKAALRLDAAGIGNFLIDAGGDIQCRGAASDGSAWTIGIRSPFNQREIVKVIRPRGYGVATSGTYARGQHIRDPHRPGCPITDILSLTVIGDDVLLADLYATAAFAMGREGIYFIEEMPRMEGYVIDRDGVATQTTGFEAFVTP
jgi:thiamine biosynthesis lipoprotein